MGGDAAATAIPVGWASLCPAFPRPMGTWRLLDRGKGRVGGAEIEGSQGFWIGSAYDGEPPETRPYGWVGKRGK